MDKKVNDKIIEDLKKMEIRRCIKEGSINSGNAFQHYSRKMIGIEMKEKKPGINGIIWGGN